jgi:hypothetical protein
VSQSNNLKNIEKHFVINKSAKSAKKFAKKFNTELFKEMKKSQQIVDY